MEYLSPHIHFPTGTELREKLIITTSELVI
jgi:hypothetical protein